MRADAPGDSLAGHAARAIVYARANLPRFVSELCALLRIPSVSGLAEHQTDARDTARWLGVMMRRAGIAEVRRMNDRGAPILIGSMLQAGDRAPTLLVYGHYDVVPPGDPRAWTSLPFEPRVRDGTIYARGASDDKGQLFAHLKALECWNVLGGPPVNVHCLFEGEEEIGSPTLLAWLQANGRALNADGAIISDTRMRAANRPAITYGLRGKLRLDLTLSRSGGELHSGDFAGVVPDLGEMLGRIIGSLADRQGRVVVPGLLRAVRTIGDAERRYMRLNGPSDAELLSAVGGSAPRRRAPIPEGSSLYERTTVGPSITVVELDAGDVGHAKSAIPTSAHAALDIRLVHDQDPRDVAALIEAHARRELGDGVRLSVHARSAVPPFIVDPRHPLVAAAERAAAAAFGQRPVFLRSGGSIPLAGALQSIGIAPVLLGFALSSDNMHGPNEHFPIARFAKAIECSIRLFAEAARPTRRAHRVRRAYAATS